MDITEPATLVTDVVLAIVVGWLGLTLIRSGRKREIRSVSSWGASFVASAIGALLGGAWHGFHDAMGVTSSQLLWKATMLVIGVASALLVYAASLATLERSSTNRLSVGLAMILAAWAVHVALFDDDFVWAIAVYVPSLLGVSGLIIWRYREQSDAAPAIIGGIALSIAAALVQQSGFSLHRHFNANDLYHVIQIVAFALMYRGGGRLADCREAAD